MPPHLTAARKQIFPIVHRLDEPLTARDDLEGTVALLEELHRMRDGPGVAEQVAGFAQQLDDAGAGFGGGETRELIVGLLRAARIARLPPGAPHVTGRSVPFGMDDGANGQRRVRATM